MSGAKITHALVISAKGWLDGSMLRVSQVEVGSVAYEWTVRLRDSVLREPLGLTFTDEERAQEGRCGHYALFEGEQLRACLVVVPRGEAKVQIRQVAVAEDQRGRGLGARLMAEVEEALRDEGIREIYLHAREEVVAFYKRLDYVPVGEPFIEIGIPHQEMGKSLSPEA